MKKTKSKQPGKRGKSRKQQPREYVYREPKTAAELKIVCSECGAPAEWFDYERGERDHRRGFICGAHPRSAHSEKLLTSAATLAA